MTGAEALVQTLSDAGVALCFANPGTSEMHFVSAVDRIPGLRPVLALHECVATGAADGYGRIAGRPAATLLHAGPGLLNGGSNLHNARRARTPLLNIVGDHATHHRGLDSPLTTDLEAIAATCADRVLGARTAAELPGRAVEAVQAAGRGAGNGRVVSLLLPADTAWTPGARPAAPLPVPAGTAPDADRVQAVAQALRRHGSKAGLVLAGAALNPGALAAAAQVAAGTGARLLASNLVPCLRRGRGQIAPETIPYAVGAALEFLKPFELLILVASGEPVSFFAYPGRPGRMAPEGCRIEVLAERDDDVAAALTALAQAAGAPAAPPAGGGETVEGSGAVTAAALAATIARHLPEEAIVVDESVSAGGPIWDALAQAAPHDVLKNMGGSIGFGLPAALGTALAAPGRKTVCLEADGSGLYTAQAIWSWAREGADVLGVIFANRRYQILQGEMKGVQAAPPGARAAEMLNIDNPAVDWTGLAKSFGIEAHRVDDMDGFNRLFAAGVRPGQGPMLLEVLT